jgi:hypothetical protein
MMAGQKLVQVKGVGVVAFPASMPDEQIAGHIQSHRQRISQPALQPAVAPGPGLDPRLSAVAKQFPRLSPYLSDVHIQQGTKSPNDDRGLEFYPPWESQNPNPGKITLELFDSLQGAALTTALGGDLLHYLGGENPQTKKPIDSDYWKMKQAVLNARTPQQDALDRRIYEQARKNEGEVRSYPDWLQQSRIDAYIRGYVTPEIGGRYPDEWRRQGMYNAPAMRDAVEQIKRYVTSPATPAAVPPKRGGAGGATNEFPPALERVRDAVGMRFAAGQPEIDGRGQNEIATVGEHEPHTVVIRDPERFKQGPRQVEGHELIHLWRNNLPGPLQKAALPDNPSRPYDISGIDALRKKGYTLATIPQEQAATIVQTYIADPSQRARLQAWIDDLNSTPLSVMNPTEPDQKGINTTVRPPAPPVEAYEGGGRGTGIRDQGSVFRGQVSGVRGQGSGFRGQNTIRTLREEASKRRGKPGGNTVIAGGPGIAGGPR